MKKIMPFLLILSICWAHTTHGFFSPWTQNRSWIIRATVMVLLGVDLAREYIIRKLIKPAGDINIKLCRLISGNETIETGFCNSWLCNLKPIKLFCIKQLLKHRANPNVLIENNITSLLHTAVSNNSPAIVKLLLAHNADVNTIDQCGYTPLQIAKNKNLHSIIKLLHKYNPVPPHALSERRLDIASLLLLYNTENVDVLLHNAAKENSPELAKLSLESNANVHAIDKTPLHRAARENSYAVAILLLAHNANVDATDKNGNTPLHYTARKNSYNMTKLLLENGANPNAIDQNGNTPLHNTAWQNSHDMAKLLLTHKANVNATNQNGNTSFHIAAWQNSYDVAKLLLDHNSNMNMPDGNGNTISILNLTLQEFPQDIANLLLECISKNLKLLNYVKNNDIINVTSLLQKSARVNFQDKRGSTPLYYAVTHNYFNMAKLLIEKGANAHLKNNSKLSPFSIAKSQYEKNTPIATLLSKQPLVLKLR